MPTIIWRSAISLEMVENLSDEAVAELIETLNDSVQEIFESFQVE